MFGDVAVRLLELMGHSGTVPSAILPEDIPAALERLRAGLDAERRSSGGTAPSEDDESLEVAVSLNTRALPLIELMEAAAWEGCAVQWDA